MERNSERKVALITGSSQRIGAGIVRSLHQEGMDVAIHFNNSESPAKQLRRQLNNQRPDSAEIFQADLQDPGAAEKLAPSVVNHFGRLDVLVNNASILDFEDGRALAQNRYQDMIGIHIGAPYYLTWSAANALRETKGCVINIVDIYAQHPKNTLVLYSATKAALESLTKSFAMEFAPDIRVNAIAPGAILWPDQPTGTDSILENTPLGRLGTVDEIADAVRFLVFDATFTTGQTITIDGGRSVTPI